MWYFFFYKLTLYCDFMSAIPCFSGNNCWRFWGCWHSDWIWWWREWKTAGRGGVAVCLVYEVVHRRHVWHWHCVCIDVFLMKHIYGVFTSTLDYFMKFLPFYSTGPVCPSWPIMSFTATCAITVATHTFLENKQVSAQCLPKTKIWNCILAFLGRHHFLFFFRLKGDVPHRPGKPDVAVQNSRWTSKDNVL